MFRLLRFYSPIALLHLYVAVRLLPDLLAEGALAIAAVAVWLLASTILIPFAFRSQRTKVPRFSLALAWVGLIAMGSFSQIP